MRQLRSTLWIRASNQSTREANVRVGRPGERVEPERAGQEVDRQVVAGAGLEQVLDLLVGLPDAELRVEVDQLELGGAEAEPPGQLGRR